MSNNNQLVHQIMREVSSLVPGIDQRLLFSKISGIVSLYKVKEINSFAYHPDISEKVEMFLSAKKLEGLSVNTIKEYRGKLRIFAKEVTKLVNDITTNDIRVFLGQYHDINKANTIDSKLSTLKSFFGWLHAEELISKDPTLKIKPVKGESNLRESLTVEELEIVRESCETLRERALVEFLYATGCRLDEVYKLDKDDIDWNNLTVKVKGKGSKERIVFLSAKTKIHLNKYFLARKDNREFLFAGERKPYNRLGHRAIQKIIKNIGIKAGIKKNLHPHIFRHTLATLMLNNGADIVVVQNILGHENVGTTQVYARASSEHIQIEYRKHLVI